MRFVDAGRDQPALGALLPLWCAGAASRAHRHGQTAVSHSPWHGDQQTHTDHATSRELKPLCAACLAEQERLAAEAAKVLGTGLAIAGGAFGLTGLLMVVVPVLLCLGGGAVLAAVSFFMERR